MVVVNLKGISLEEFFNLLGKQPIQKYIVWLRQKASNKTEWEYLKEILNVDLDYDGYYVWDSDWNEGQQDVEVLGYIAIDDITQFNTVGK